MVWLSGELNGVAEDAIFLRLTGDREVRVRRLAAGTTRFLQRDDGDGWSPVDDEEALLLEAGTPACIESLADPRAYFALRVYIGVACGPSS